MEYEYQKNQIDIAKISARNMRVGRIIVYRPQWYSVGCKVGEMLLVPLLRPEETMQGPNAKRP